MAEVNQTPSHATASSAIDTRLPPPVGFERFFRTSFRELTKTAMYAGATPQEAEDAAAKTLEEMLPLWTSFQRPLSYARQAVVHNFIKDKTRGTHRIAKRLIERGHVAHQEATEDDELTAREGEEWVAEILGCLPPAQREVMGYIARGYSRDEIAEVLGKSREAIRRNLCDARVRLAKELQRNGEQKQSDSPPASSPGRRPDDDQ